MMNAKIVDETHHSPMVRARFETTCFQERTREASDSTNKADSTKRKVEQGRRS